jgi:hypothetical protein
MLGSIFLNGQSSRLLPDLAEFDPLISYRIVQEWTQTGTETDQSSTAEKVESPGRVEAVLVFRRSQYSIIAYFSAPLYHVHPATSRWYKAPGEQRFADKSCPGVICTFWSERGITFSTFLLYLVDILLLCTDLTVAFTRVSLRVRKGAVA